MPFPFTVSDQTPSLTVPASPARLLWNDIADAVVRNASSSTHCKCLQCIPWCDAGPHMAHRNKAVPKVLCSVLMTKTCLWLFMWFLCMFWRVGALSVKNLWTTMCTSRAMQPCPPLRLKAPHAKRTQKQIRPTPRTWEQKFSWLSWRVFLFDLSYNLLLE